MTAPASLPILRAVIGSDRPAPHARAPLQQRLLGGPWLPLLILAGVFLLVGPWVNAGLNDDWQYARAAKLLAETGTLTIDTPIAPSIVVQSYLGAAVSKLFGFSFNTLRVLTVLLAGLGLVCIERTLRRVRVPGVWIMASCALLVLNPIMLHISIGYLSEWYGYVFALLAMLLWFFVRTKRGDDAALPVWLYLVAAALAVIAFWSRQFVVLVYPALVASRLLSWWRAGLKNRLLEIGGAVAGTALVAGGVLGYFAWARATGNYKPEFATPVAALTTFSAKIWLIQFSACLAYMSASFAPVLLLALPRLDNRRAVLVGAGCLAFMIAGLLALQVTGGDGFVPDRPLNARFPYVNNIIYPTGVGPVTLSDVYVQRVGARPHWSSESLWLCIEFAILLSTVCWSALVVPVRDVTSIKLDSARGARQELSLFAAAWLIGSLILSIQAYQKDVFDRYYFPCILALVLLVPALLTETQVMFPRFGVRTMLAGLSMLGLSWFSIAGVHDYLRWNEVRNELYQQTLANGVSPSSIDAGYEPNGWHNVHQTHPVTCIGQCRCDPWSWYCFDNSYRILMGGVPPGYQLVTAVTPSYWLADGPPLSLVRRAR